MASHSKVFDEFKIFVALFWVSEVGDKFGDLVVRLESVVRSHVSEIGGLASGAGLLGGVGSHERPGTGKVGLERSSSFIGLFKVSLGGSGARFLTGPGVDEGASGGGVGIFALGVVRRDVRVFGRFARASVNHAGAFGVLLSENRKRGRSNSGNAYRLLNAKNILTCRLEWRFCQPHRGTFRLEELGRKLGRRHRKCRWDWRLP